ncbi:MAG: LysM peptidoglycan-binding domain-containing protein [Pyrinomonadaceae bacterium]
MNVKAFNTNKLLGFLFILASAVAVSAQSYKIETGERIHVRIEDKISSKTSQVGDTFMTKVTEPVYAANGVVVIPNGSTIVGTIDAITKAQKGGDPGTISVSFKELRLPNGTRKAIVGTLTSLDTDKAKSDNEGTASGDKMKNRKIIFIGGGGAGGALIGAMIGGGKGAIIGGIVGAVGGILGDRLTKGEEAEVKAGTEFGVYIEKDFYLPKYSANEVSEVPGNDNPQTPTVPGEYKTYVVQRGDTLGRISFRMYGTTRRYMEIYEANRDQLPSPSQITVGQTLRIPMP